MRYFSGIFLFVKTAIYFLVQLIIGIFWWTRDKQNWKTIRMYFEMARKLSKFAKREKIAKNIGWLAKKFDGMTKEYSDEDTQKAANEITVSKGIIKDLTLGYTEGVITGNIAGLEAKYNPKDGSVKFGLKL